MTKGGVNSSYECIGRVELMLATLQCVGSSGDIGYRCKGKHGVCLSDRSYARLEQELGRQYGEVDNIAQNSYERFGAELAGVSMSEGAIVNGYDYPDPDPSPSSTHVHGAPRQNDAWIPSPAPSTSSKIQKSRGPPLLTSPFTR